MSLYTLAVADTLTVPVSFKVADGAKASSFSFSLSMDRQAEDEWKAAISDEDGIVQSAKVKQRLLDITTGWKGQTFVKGPDGQPADFCGEAFEVMLDAPGVSEIILRSFIKENTAKAKNS